MATSLAGFMPDRGNYNSVKSIVINDDGEVLGEIQGVFRGISLPDPELADTRFLVVNVSVFFYMGEPYLYSSITVSYLAFDEKGMLLMEPLVFATDSPTALMENQRKAISSYLFTMWGPDLAKKIWSKTKNHVRAMLR